MYLIGILRCIIELGRVDICLELSMISSHMALPSKGHLEKVLHIFSYFNKHHNDELVFDTSDSVVDEEIMSLKIGHQVSLVIYMVKSNCLPTF